MVRRSALLWLLLLPAIATSPPPDLCAGLDGVTLPDGYVVCTHGDDHGLRPTHAAGQESAAEVDRPAGPVPTAPTQCYGDGRNGQRVEVLFAHPASAGSRAGTLDADLRRWVGQVEWTVSASAARYGHRRHVRWVTEADGAGGCRVAIAAVALPDDAFADLGATVGALRARGFDRPDRTYLVFADVDVLCGVATVPTDDRPGPDNRAVTDAGYARIDRGCWDVGDVGTYSVAAHELLHTLGAVQPSAPHATTQRHCTDEYDVMCYADGAGLATTVVCRDQDPATTGQGDTNNRLLDCSGDDYFHPAPPPGSYLADHWNTALHPRLATTSSDGPGYPTRPRVEPDPRQRPQRWPTSDLGGPHRPVLPDGYGWEVCDLPVEVAVHTAATAEPGLLDGLLGDTPPPDDELVTLVRSAETTIEQAVGRDVLTVTSTDQTAPPAEGALVRWGGAPGATHIELRVSGARIRQGVLTIDRARLPRDPAWRRTIVLQGVVQLLGVGRVGGTADLMSPYPPADADRRVALAALRHLYRSPCDSDPRLDDTAPGHPSQRAARGTRERIDLATGSSGVVAAALDVAAWLRATAGGRWADRAVVCRDDVHADCLAGTALAGSTGVVLYVPGGPRGRAPEAVLAELDRTVRVGGSVVILGGPQAVSPTVEQQLRGRLAGRDVQRIAGADRFATAAAVSERVAAPGTGLALLARGDEPADAVAAGAAAARAGIPILLTQRDHLPEVTATTLSELGVRTVLVLGGPAAVSPTVTETLAARGYGVTRLAGATRNGTSVAIATAPSLWDRTQASTSASFIALNGWHPQSWALAVAAAPVGARLEAPVLYTLPDRLPDEVATYVRDLAVSSGAHPDVRTVYVGAGTWSAPQVAEAFHGAVLPGSDGNVRVVQR